MGSGQSSDIAHPADLPQKIHESSDPYSASRSHSPISSISPTSSLSSPTSLSKSISQSKLFDDPESESETLLLDILPFPLPIIKMVREYSTQGFIEGELISEWRVSPEWGCPYGLTTDGQYLYMTVVGPNCLCRYTFDGQLLNTWTARCTNSFSFLSESKLFKAPFGIDFYKNRLYVVDYGRCQILNLKGEIARQWPLPVNDFAWGIKVDDGEIFITVHGSHQILCYHLNGTMKRRYGLGRGSNPGEFLQPTGITVNDDFLYVCDYRNHRIQVLDRNYGSLYLQWGSHGIEEGQFVCPYQILISNHMIYVTDNFSVQIFDKNGNFEKRISNNNFGSLDGQFSPARQILVIDHRLYVAEYSNQKIQVFQ